MSGREGTVTTETRAYSLSSRADVSPRGICFCARPRKADSPHQSQPLV